LRQIEGRWKSDISSKVDALDVRVRTIERMIYIAIGGIIVIGGLVSFLGGTILKILQHA
jgi:hypothetical protein